MSLGASSCSTIDKAPISMLYVPLITRMTCDETKCVYEGACDVRKITDKKTLSSVRVRVGHLKECHGTWGLSAEEFGKLRIYMKNN